MNINFSCCWAVRFKLHSILEISALAVGIIIFIVSQYTSLGVQDIGLVAILASVSEICLTRVHNKSNLKYQINQELHRPLQILIVLLITTSVIQSLAFNYHRSLGYYLIVSTAGALLGFEIFTTALNGVNKIILMICIGLLSFSVWSAIFFEFPTLIGSDVWAHASFASFILDYGKVPSSDLYHFLQYNDFPLMHIMFVDISAIFNIPMKDAIFISAASTFLATMIFVYLIGREIADERAGLFSMFMISISDMILVNSISLITPQMIVLPWFAAVIYLTFKKEVSPPLIFLMIFLLLSMVPTHQVSVFITTMALIAFIIGNEVYKYYKNRLEFEVNRSNQKNATIFPVNANYTILLLFIIAFTTYWSSSTSRGENGKNFFSMMADILIQSITEKPGVYLSSNPFSSSLGGHDILSAALFHLGFLFLLFLGLIGILLFSRKEALDNKKFSIGCAIILMTIIAYGTPLTGLKDAVLPERWIPYIYILLVIPASIAILAILQRISKRRAKAIVAMLVPFAFVFCMVTTPYVTADNPIFEGNRVTRSAFTYSEVSSSMFLANHFDGTVVTDAVFASREMSYGLRNSSNLDVQSFNKVSFYDLFAGNGENKTVLLRLALIEEPTIVSRDAAFGRTTFDVVGNEIINDANAKGANIMYSNGYNMIYLV